MKKSLFLTLICLFAVLSAFVAPGGETARAAESRHQNHTLGAEEITLVDSSTNLNTKLSASTSETYLPSDRKWNGIATSGATYSGSALGHAYLIFNSCL